MRRGGKGVILNEWVRELNGRRTVSVLGADTPSVIVFRAPRGRCSWLSASVKVAQALYEIR
jgi:hypothetical protein